MTKRTTKQRNEELNKEGLQLRHYGMKFRMEPTSFQQERIHQHIGCTRFVYNFYLNERQEVYRNTGENLSYSTFKKYFNAFKQNPLVSWLKAVDKFALECAMEQVDDAFIRFFKGQNRYPRFKRKHKSRQSYSTKETNGNIRLDVKNQTVQLPKIGKVSIRIPKKVSETLRKTGLRGRVKGATVSYHASGQFYVSLKLEEVVSLETPPDLSLIPEDQITGCDLGLTHFLIHPMERRSKTHVILRRI